MQHRPNCSVAHQGTGGIHHPITAPLYHTITQIHFTNGNQHQCTASTKSPGVHKPIALHIPALQLRTTLHETQCTTVFLMYSLYCSDLYNVYLHSGAGTKRILVAQPWRSNMNLTHRLWKFPLILSVSDVGQYVRVLLLICNALQDLSTLVSCTFFVNWPPP